MPAMNEISMEVGKYILNRMLGLHVSWSKDNPEELKCSLFHAVTHVISFEGIYSILNGS
jgi:hypothetical protein